MSPFVVKIVRFVYNIIEKQYLLKLVIIKMLLWYMNLHGIAGRKTLRVEVELVQSPDKEGAHIKTMEISDDINKAIELLENNSRSLVVYKAQQAYVCEYREIYYIESVDNKCFVYTKSECFQTKHKLYELEMMLDVNFFRCSKSMICNVKKIKSVKAEYNARMRATLINGEAVIISRSYVKDLKKRLGI